MTDAMHIMLLNHTLLGHVGGGKWPGDEAKPCHVLLEHYHKSVLTVALYTCLWYNLDPELADCYSNQCVKLKYLRIALITAWKGADSAAALKDAV